MGFFSQSRVTMATAPANPSDRQRDGDSHPLPGASGASGRRTGGDVDSDREAEEIRIGWRMAGLGFQVASEVAAGALLGWLCDRWRGTDPTGLLVGAIVGIVVGLWSLIRGSLKLNRELDTLHPAGPRITTRTPPEQWDDEKHDDFWPDDDHPSRDEPDE